MDGDDDGDDDGNDYEQCPYFTLCVCNYRFKTLLIHFYQFFHFDFYTIRMIRCSQQLLRWNIFEHGFQINIFSFNSIFQTLLK